MSPLSSALEFVDGWRLFGVDGERLVAPLVGYLFELTSAPAWEPGLNRAVCLNDRPCLPPIRERCTCGFRAVEDLGILLERAESFTDECGALVRVRLSGVVHEGVMIPTEDPPTTWRGSQAEIIEIHLAPQHESSAGRIKSHYDVPVVVYEPQEWPGEVRPVDPLGPKREVSEADFRAAMRGLTFGKAGRLSELVDMGAPEADAVLDTLVDTAWKAAEAMTGQVTAEDLARTLYGGAFAPSVPEATAFVGAVIEHLYPHDPRSVSRGHVFTRPVTMSEQLNRDLSAALSSVARLAP